MSDSPTQPSTSGLFWVVTIAAAAAVAATAQAASSLLPLVLTEAAEGVRGTG
jgi:hypothetical protein